MPTNYHIEQHLKGINALSVKEWRRNGFVCYSSANSFSGHQIKLGITGSGKYAILEKGKIKKRFNNAEDAVLFYAERLKI